MILFTFTNSVDPDEMKHYAAFHLGLHCLQMYSFRGFTNAKSQHGNLYHADVSCRTRDLNCYPSLNLHLYFVFVS